MIRQYTRLAKALRGFCKKSAVVALLGIGPGCATIFSSSKYTLNVDCNEPCATVDVYKGKTRISTITAPARVSLSAGDGFFVPARYRFVFSKPGFREDERKVSASIDPWYFGNIVIGGLLGAGIIDPATGAMWKLPAGETVMGRLRRDANAMSERAPEDEYPGAGVDEGNEVAYGENAGSAASNIDAEQNDAVRYKIVSCARESGTDFCYRFSLELEDTGGDSDPLKAFRSVRQKFRTAIKEDYAESFPNVKRDNLFVEFPEYKQSGNRIDGRAVVLTITVASLSYDPNTRTGKLAVKVNANQYEEARKWIRRNIETLARDKNIALTTGEIPPAAKFYLGREELKDGNVLEIEFKTE